MVKRSYTYKGTQTKYLTSAYQHLYAFVYLTENPNLGLRCKKPCKKRTITLVWCLALIRHGPKLAGNHDLCRWNQKIIICQIFGTYKNTYTKNQ
jgi:hypothetical protein